MKKRAALCLSPFLLHAALCLSPFLSPFLLPFLLHTSWTTEESVAHEKATTSTEDNLVRTHGVVLEDQVPASQLIRAPEPVAPNEKEVLRRGPVTAAKAQPVPKPETQ